MGRLTSYTAARFTARSRAPVTQSRGRGDWEHPFCRGTRPPLFYIGLELPRSAGADRGLGPSPRPLFTRVRGRIILRASPRGVLRTSGVEGSWNVATIGP